MKPHPPRKDAPVLFERALDEVRPQCDGRWVEFTDYDSEDPYMPDPPSPRQAQELCAGCPLIELCAEAALVKKPYHGIRAGRVWDNGKVVR